MRQYIKVAILSLASLLLFWIPFLLHLDQVWTLPFDKRGMETIVQNFDGLNFLVVAKTFYEPKAIEELNREFLTGNEPIYFTAHYPLYAGVIRFFDLFMTGPQALLATIVFANILLATGLYFFFSTLLKNKEVAVLLTAVSLFLPARMLSVRAVGSNEPFFLFFVFTSLAFHIRSKHLLAAVAGVLAVLTRSPGIILFGAYFLAIVFTNWKRWASLVRTLIPYLLMPLSLIGLWLYYGWRFGNIWAYFQSGDNIHLFFPPFQIFNSAQTWVGTMWLEDVLYIFLLFTMGIVLFGKRYVSQGNRNSTAVLAFGVLYLVSLFFVAHRDISRYALPIAPLVVVGFGQELARREFRYVFYLLIIPIYLLGWNFVLHNIQPINNWIPFL